jgi:hypothetical protein
MLWSVDASVLTDPNDPGGTKVCLCHKRGPADPGLTTLIPLAMNHTYPPLPRHAPSIKIPSLPCDSFLPPLLCAALLWPGF